MPTSATSAASLATRAVKAAKPQAKVMLPAVLVLAAAAAAGEQSARRPPMGWNSWDSFQGNLDEAGALEVAAVMKKFLLPAGYDTLTIDEFWYPGDCHVGSKCIDANGRPQPDVRKWPSSAGGKGFKAVTDKIVCAHAPTAVL